MTVGLKMCVPASATSTAFQEIVGGQRELAKSINERWTISGYLDHSEGGIVDEGWGWVFKVPGTAAAGSPSYSALEYMFRQTAVTGGSANLVQIVWTNPILNATVTSTGYFESIGAPQWLDPYNFLVECKFRKYQGP